MNYKIKTLSPVHIGSGETLSPLDYVCTGEHLAVFSLVNLVDDRPERAAGIMTEVENFARTAGEQKNPKQLSLDELLEDDEKRNKAYHREPIHLPEHTKRLLTAQNRRGFAADVARCIKLPWGESYIPGSSIKGALRTAVLYGFLKEEPEYLSKIKKARPREISSILSGLAMPQRGGGGAHQDIFKALAVSDTTAKNGRDTVSVEPVKTLSPSTRFIAKPWWNFWEVVRENTAFDTSITVSESLLKHPDSRSLLHLDGRAITANHLRPAEIARYARTFAADLTAHELDYFRGLNRSSELSKVIGFYEGLQNEINSSKGESFILRVGMGSGWLGETIGLLLRRDAEYDYMRLRKELNLGKRGREDFPKTRQLTAAGENRRLTFLSPPGWLKLWPAGEGEPHESRNGKEQKRRRPTRKEIERLKQRFS